jgi:ubiquinone/menaquinone biosynthesis C-methylase UbiE
MSPNLATRWQSNPTLVKAALNRFLVTNLVKRAYPMATGRLASTDVVFLNYGYEDDPPMAIPLSESDEVNRYFIQLYHRTVACTDLTDKRVLEVSCGHGGGASYIARYLHPSSYVGLDLNPKGIEFCRRTHKLPGLEFVRGDAVKLPFPDESFDAVVNVEASHGYASFAAFLGEVTRVLRPGGDFLYADLRHRYVVADWEADFAASALLPISCEPINEQVVRGMERTSDWRRGVIETYVPRYARPSMRMIAGVPGPGAFDDLSSGDHVYRACHFLKPPAP